MSKCVRRVLCLAMMLLLVLTVTGCEGSQSTEAGYAKIAWKAVGDGEKPSSVHCIHFTDSNALTSASALPDASVVAVPTSGYAYVFGPSGDAFEGLSVCFLTESGVLISVIRYDTLYDAYDALAEESAAQKTLYLNACNYLAFMYAETLEGSAELGRDAKTNQWYVMTDAQINAMMK